MNERDFAQKLNKLMIIDRDLNGIIDEVKKDPVHEAAHPVEENRELPIDDILDKSFW